MSIDFEDLKGKIRGPTVLMMAPFKDNDELNIEAVKESMRFMMDGGISGKGKGVVLYPCGTGEYVTLSHEEHKAVVKAAVEVGGSELMVVAGVTSNNYKEVIKVSLNAADAGAKCVMIPPPYYYPITQEGIYRWYKIIAEEIKIGIMAYDQPWREHSGGSISDPLLGKLAEIENIVAIKYGGKVLRDYIKTLDLYSKRFSFMDNCGAGVAAFMHGEAGFTTANGAFWPEFDAKYWSLVEQGKYEEASKWRTKAGPIGEFARSEGPFFQSSGIKAALEYVGLYGGPVRPPFIELTKEQKKKYFGVLEGLGVPKKR